MSFWDTSALAKLYVPEADSGLFQQFVAQTATLAVARLALMEMRRVAHQKETEGFLQKGGAELILQQLTTDAQNGRLNIVEFQAGWNRNSPKSCRSVTRSRRPCCCERSTACTWAGSL